MRSLCIFILTAIVMLSACGNTDSTMEEHEKIADQLDPTGDEGLLGDPQYNDPEQKNRLGFVNYKRADFDQSPNKHQSLTMDRRAMADMIARAIMQNEGFDEIATLVTGEEVLIAYNRNEAISEDEASEIARKTAMSVMPRFFEIYVSSNEALIPDIQSLHNSTTDDADYNNTLEQIIQNMKTRTPADEDNT